MMLRRLALAALLALAPSLCLAADPIAFLGVTAAPGDNSNRIATTAFVTAAVGGGGLPTLANGSFWIGNVSNVATARALSQDCTVSNTGVMTCTKTNNVSFAASATTDTTNASNIATGTLANARAAATNLAAGNVNGGVVGATPFANGGCNGVTQQANFDNCAPTATRAGDLLYWNGTHYVTLPGNNSGTQFLQETSAGVPSWATVAGTGTVTTLTAGAGIAFSSGATCTTACTVRLALNSATLQSSPADPSSTTSGTGVMMGFGSGCTLTPVYGTRVQLAIQGTVANTGVGNASLVTAKFGTGAAPANGAATTGTAVGSSPSAVAGIANQFIPFNVGGVITGLTVGTAYWFDISLATTAGTTAIKSNSCSAIEF